MTVDSGNFFLPICHTSRKRSEHSGQVASQNRAGRESSYPLATGAQIACKCDQLGVNFSIEELITSRDLFCPSPSKIPSDNQRNRILVDVLSPAVGGVEPFV
jgi:hypothetical protein